MTTPQKRQRILVPVEESDISRRALIYALNLAERRDYEVYMYRVGSPKKYGKIEGEELKTQLDSVLAELEKFLSAALVTIAREREFDVGRLGAIHKRFAVGDLQTEILRMAGNISAAVILFGVTSNEDPDYETGSFEFDSKMAAGIVSQAPCSVFTVKAIDETFVLL